MEGADQPSAVSCRHIFRAIEYIVSLQVVQGTTLIVTVEDRLTADQWRGEFDARYVEDLTHKTGNFKQFNVFVSMLESAVLKGSSSVCLDLLTYADLESLRHNKPGAGTKNVPGARAGTNLNTKRYLILTYTVEFDRIHYPLPLPYVGKPDPVLLQDTIQKLREEIKSLKVQLSKGSRTTELTKVQKECERALQDKENLAAEFELYKEK